MSKRQLFPTIAQAFLHRARMQPDSPAFFSKEGAGWTSVTWKEYYDNVRWISLGLMELDAKPGDNISIIGATRLEWTASDMAILGARGVTVPVYASNTADETAFILKHCEATFVFVEDNKQLEKVLSVRDQLPNLKKIIVFSPSATPAMAEDKNILSLAALRDLGKRARNIDRFDQNLMSLQPSDVMTVCYTSGTTGVPKGVVLTFDNLASVLEDVDKSMGSFVGEKDVVLAFLPISHIFGKVESMAVYHFGWRVYYAESIEKLLFNMGEVSPTILFAVPRVFEKAYNRIRAGVEESSAVKKGLFDWAFAAGHAYFDKIWSGKRPSPTERIQYIAAKQLVFKKVYQRFGGRLKFCVAGGAPLPQAIGEFMRIVGITILEGYGLTETCAPVTLNTPYGMKFGSIGRPLPEVSMKIAEDGEILVKSRKVFREYYKNPEATAEVLDKDGWFHTGDIGVIDDQGFVRITDRKKDLIITSGGKNVAPQKIENLAKTNKFVTQFVVFGDRRNYLTALVCLDKEEAIKYAKEHYILFSEYTELVKNPKIQALVQKIVDELNSHLASFESIKRFKILPNEFSIETGEITPSLKIRRKFTAEKYRGELDALYGTEVI